MNGDLSEGNDPSMFIADLDADSLDGAAEDLIFGGDFTGEVGGNFVVE